MKSLRKILRVLICVWLLFTSISFAIVFLAAFVIGGLFAGIDNRSIIVSLFGGALSVSFFVDFLAFIHRKKYRYLLMIPNLIAVVVMNLFWGGSSNSSLITSMFLYLPVIFAVLLYFLEKDQINNIILPQKE